YKDDCEYARQQEEAITKFAVVIENADDERVKASSIQGIVQYLSIRGRYDEAKAYAEQYPENYSVSKDMVLLNCLQGEEREIHYQNMLDSALFHFLDLLGRNSKAACDAQRQILKVMISDENYSYYNCILAENYLAETRFMLSEKNWDGAMEMLKRAFYYAEEYDKCDSGEFVTYTCHFFSKLKFETKGIVKSGMGTQVEDFKERLMKSPWYEPLRGRDDFKDLVK
ncbi:MAG: hypothetical protein K2J79_05755, partial [Ruminiclostridium sp.]|nr:hypothetical protein [Ruminiclostridium sp.]